ncbi:hypothetical protein PUN28_016839 [Cardiocondyla obscurior]|uniref:Uncharacterized protein n=1 Tax=Cardiocondyla obscurior TaxID=286306 RepID=A0AAW2EUU3_9HYME
MHPAAAAVTLRGRRSREIYSRHSFVRRTPEKSKIIPSGVDCRAPPAVILSFWVKPCYKLTSKVRRRSLLMRWSVIQFPPSDAFSLYSQLRLRIRSRSRTRTDRGDAYDDILYLSHLYRALTCTFSGTTSRNFISSR